MLNYLVPGGLGSFYDLFLSLKKAAIVKGWLPHEPPLSYTSSCLAAS